MRHIRGRKEKSGKSGWLFLASVLLLYGLAALIDSDLTLNAAGYFLQIVGSVVPVLVLVFILIFLFNLFFDAARIERHLGRKSGLKGWLFAVAAGVLSTGPVYAWYAVLAEFKRRGMRPSLVAVFLYSRAVKIPLLPLMVHYFGVDYTLVLSLYLIGFSIISGLLMGLIEGGASRPGS